MSDRPVHPSASASELHAVRGGSLAGALPVRTAVGFVAAALAVVLIAALSYSTLQSRTAGAKRIAHTLDVVNGVEELLAALRDSETGQRGYLITGEEPYLEPYERGTAEFPRVAARVRDAVADNPAQLQRLEALVEVARVRTAILVETVVLRRAGKTDEAVALVRDGRGKVYMDRARAIAAEMKADELTLLGARTAEWESTAELSTLVTWAGSALLLFLIGAAATMSARDLREQRVQAWLRTGQNELSLRVQGEQEVGALSDTIAAFLARYLDAQVGLIYFAADAKLGLRRVGGYALPAADGRGAPATGLTLQALQDGETKLLLDVPADYVPVSSGLGSSRPRHLVVVPAHADGVPTAVLELGFLRAPGAHDLELLRRVSEQVAIALRSCKLRKDVELLLAETQRQAEELQSRQEELRVQNEELEQQSKALQDSQARLENQQSELEQINSQLEEQTQALEQQRDDLSRAQGDLQRSSAYKSEFLANMSHELRTPLNSSLILAKLLLDNREGNLTGEQVKFAQTIYSAGNDLLTLINDILDLSKIEAGKLDVRPETVSLRRLVDDLTHGFQPIAQQKGLELSLTVEQGAETIHTDPQRLQQILRNLLSNALKFTERGGVSLRVRRARDGGLAFDVKDTGIGIPPAQHEVIFEAFRQADGTTNRRYGGTGLGLSISRDLARLLGGEVTLESAPGRGSTFTLVLPAQHVARPSERPPTPSPSPPPRRPLSGLSGPAGQAAHTAAPTGLPPPAAGAVPDDRDRLEPGARAILVVEDDPAFAKIVLDLAHELDFRCLVAHTAEEGLLLAERLRPSAIVLDVNLPDRSGLSVLDALKHSPATRHIPVHMMSVADYAQTALEMGATGYAIKPVKREQLVDALKRLETKFTQTLRRVLVVEDDEVLRQSTCKLLAADDVETVAVGTARDALERLRTTTFDCVVLDLTLPDRNGFELLDEMSRSERASFPPVIVYTGRSLSRDEEQRLRRTSSSIIVKGARSPERLLDEVTLFLHQVEAELPPERQRMLRAARHREAVFEGKRVLVVEDDVRNVFALTSVLEPKGARVEIARNGVEALAHLKAKPGVDLVLMDIMMPEMDGLTCMRELRKDPALARLPIIALTAKAMADDREGCLAAGANDYIAKPLDVDKLLSLARVWMPR